VTVQVYEDVRLVQQDKTVGVIYALALEDGAAGFASKVGRGTSATACQYAHRRRHTAGLRPIATAIAKRDGVLMPEWAVLMSSTELSCRWAGDRWTSRLSELLELAATAVLCISISEFHGCGGHYGDATTAGASVAGES
jgi:hypothetical protein